MRYGPRALHAFLALAHESAAQEGERSARRMPPDQFLRWQYVRFKLHENGITRDLTMDYGDFSMTGKLVNLSLFDQTKPCPASK